MITLFLDLVLDYEGHVAVGQTDVVFQVNPTVVLVIESMPLMVPKSLTLLGISSILIDLANIVAFELDSLLSDINSLLLSDVGMSIWIPENLWLQIEVERFELAVLLYVPSHHAIWSQRLAYHDCNSVGTSSPHLFDLSLLFVGWHVQAQLPEVCVWLFQAEVPDVEVIPKEHIAGVDRKAKHTVIK